jgi:tetratricopeptide (TPR) repeat protein
MTDNEVKEKELFLLKAESFLAQGLYQEAQDIAEERLGRFPADVDARMIVCHAWMRMGKLDRVRQMLREVDKAIFAMSRIYERMGDICRQAGLNGEAVGFYRKFITLNPCSSLTESVSKKLSSLLSSQGRTDISEEESDAERVYHIPGLKTVTMAELYLRQGHQDLARNVLEEILEKNPTDQRATAMLRNLQTVPHIGKAEMGKRKPEEIICELSRWLNNVHRLRSHVV